MDFKMFLLMYMKSKKEYTNLVDWLLLNCPPQEDTQPLTELSA